MELLPGHVRTITDKAFLEYCQARLNLQFSHPMPSGHKDDTGQHPVLRRQHTGRRVYSGATVYTMLPKIWETLAFSDCSMWQHEARNLTLVLCNYSMGSELQIQNKAEHGPLWSSERNTLPKRLHENTYTLYNHLFYDPHQCTGPALLAWYPLEMFAKTSQRPFSRVYWRRLQMGRM